MELNYTKTLVRVITNTYTRYRGTIIEKRGKDFIALRKHYGSMEAAKTAVDNAYDFLKTSVK